MLEKEWKELEIIGDGDLRINRAMDILEDATKAVENILGKQARTEICLMWKTEIDKELAKLEEDDSEYCRHTEYFAY